MVRVLPCTAALRLRVTGDTRTLPFGPGVAPSSRESSCPLSLTLITLPVFFPLVTFVVDRVAELTFVLVVVPLVVDRVLVHNLCAGRAVGSKGPRRRKIIERRWRRTGVSGDRRKTR